MKVEYKCELFSLENKTARAKFCKIKQSEANGKDGVDIQKCELVKKKHVDRDPDGNVSEYEEFLYLLEWTEMVPGKKRKSNALP